MDNVFYSDTEFVDNTTYATEAPYTEPDSLYVDPTTSSPQGAIISKAATSPQGAIISNATTSPQGAIISNATTSPQGAIISNATTSPPGNSATLAALIGPIGIQNLCPVSHKQCNKDCKLMNCRIGICMDKCDCLKKKNN